MTPDNWELMTVDERHEYILSKLKSGELEIVYARPGTGLFYLTVSSPKDGIRDGKVIVDGKIVGRQG